MRLSDETYEYIKQAVADMYTFYNIKGVPINSFEVASKIGITVIPYSDLDESSLEDALNYNEDGFSIESNDGQWIIFYNDSQKKLGRINQTIMHEIAHFILGHTDDGPVEEAEAKFFAKYALVSPPLIHNLIEVKTIENISDSFAIGYRAASIALDNYRSWLSYGKKDYTIYEQQIMTQLEIL